MLFALIFWIVLSLSGPASANWSPLIDRLVADGFDASVIQTLFSRPEVKFEPRAMTTKIETLLTQHAKIPGKPPSYNPQFVYGGFLTEKIIARARSYQIQNEGLLESISRTYGVPKEIVVSIVLVETRLGDFLGKQWAFNSLAGMALCTELEMIRPFLTKKQIDAGNETLARTLCLQKANWAYAELKALIRYASSVGYDPLRLPGSIYGAIGLCQFMPSNVLPYGVDGDNDGRIDLFSKADAFASIANFLVKHGWKRNLDKNSQFQVILAYNRSSIYGNTVLGVAEKIRVKS